MIVLVTGATGGFGQVLTAKLSAAGHTVYGTSRNPQAFDAAVPLLPLDVTSQTSVEQCVDAVLAKEGRLDVVVNCVNELVIAATEEQDWDEVSALYDTNVFGAMRVCQAALKHFRQRSSGLIINMSSLGGLLAVPYMGAYTSSKFALEAFSEALYHELRGTNIDVVILQPVAMTMDRPHTGTHMRLGRKVGDQSLSYKVLDIMVEDSRTSTLAPDTVAAKVLALVESKRRPLRVSMDRAAVLSKLKRVLPQVGINKLIDGLLARSV